MRRSIVVLACAAALGVLAAPASAGPVENAFRDFIERLRQQGTTVTEALIGDRWVPVRTPVLERRVDELPLGRGMYAVFVAPGCRECKEALQHLSRHGRKVEVLDLGQSPTAREAYKLAEGHGLPLILVGNHRLTGWNKRLFDDAVRHELNDATAGQQGSGA